MLRKQLIVVAATLAIAGCALENQGVPPLSGPSELGLSIGITATPDILTQDGVSQAQIEVTVLDSNSQPVRGLTLRADIAVGGIIVDFGALSSKTISTDSNGRARLTYFSPGAPPASATGDNVVQILVTPVGANYANATYRDVQILLTRPGVILPPNGAPVPSFFFSPTTPKQEESVAFDASASRDDGRIVLYEWAFGDGDIRTTTNPRITHAYELAGTYNIVLTVTDDTGVSRSTAPTPITVAASAAPTANFSFSPVEPKKNETVFFNAQLSVAAPGRTISSYAWDFGDGEFGSGSKPQHTYGKEATYTVTLVVTDSEGVKGAVAKTITICPAEGCTAEAPEEE